MMIIVYPFLGSRRARKKVSHFAYNFQHLLFMLNISLGNQKTFFENFRFFCRQTFPQNFFCEIQTGLCFLAIHETLLNVQKLAEAQIEILSSTAHHFARDALVLKLWLAERVNLVMIARSSCVFLLNRNRWFAKNVCKWVNDRESERESGKPKTSLKF